MRLFVRLLIVPVVAALAALLAAAPGARADTDLSQAPRPCGRAPFTSTRPPPTCCPRRTQKALADKIEDADKPVFVAVLPEGYPTRNIFKILRTETGVTGLYGIRLGDRFDAKADHTVLSPQGVSNLVTAVQGTGDPKAQLNDFVDDALRNIGGSAPSGWDGGGTDVPVTGLAVTGAVLAAGGVGAYALARRNRRRREEEQRAALEKLRVVVDEDMTAFGEELGRLDFHPAEPGADDAMHADYRHALDAYEQAKTYMAEARAARGRAGRHPGPGGRPLLAGPARRPALGRAAARTPAAVLFDPRHGPSVADVTWTPPGGATRQVPVCAADRARLDDGLGPMIREVDTDYGRRPYWDAGPAYGPWAGGYFGGGILPGLLMGTVLGSMMAGLAYGAGYGAGYGDFGGGFEGGDVSGADFDPGDFGGGFGGGDFGGGGGGNDFGGGF
ncbi:TPM domain-containing protein OS=Streptomyces fumanus OX=67302 GN=GCM10018772_53630 PE=4 SV=1 [Streptomyces fumanus]